MKSNKHGLLRSSLSIFKSKSDVLGYIGELRDIRDMDKLNGGSDSEDCRDNSRFHFSCCAVAVADWV